MTTLHEQEQRTRALITKLNEAILESQAPISEVIYALATIYTAIEIVEVKSRGPHMKRDLALYLTESVEFIRESVLKGEA